MRESLTSENEHLKVDAYRTQSILWISSTQNYNNIRIDNSATQGHQETQTVADAE